MGDLHVVGILACEVDYILEVSFKVGTILDVISNCFNFCCRCLVYYELVVYAVGRKACDVINTYRAVCLNRERCGCSEESRALS